MASSTTVSVGDPLPGEPFGACCHDGDEDRVCVLARDGAGHSVARLLNMRETLDANGIPDEDMQFDQLNIDPDAYIPIIHLYFSDDLSVA